MIQKKILPDDLKIGQIWDELTQIQWISEVFGDILENLQAKAFIDTLENLQKKIPNLDLEIDISYAYKVLEN